MIVIFVAAALFVLFVSSKLIYCDLQMDEPPTMGYRYAFKNGHAEISNHGTRIDSIYVDPMYYAENRSEGLKKMLIFIDGLKIDPVQELKPESQKFKKIALLANILRLDSVYLQGNQWDNVKKLEALTAIEKSDKRYSESLKVSEVAELSSLIYSIEIDLLSYANVKTLRLDTIRNKIGTAAYLNTHTQVLSWIIFHTTALSLSVVGSLYLLILIGEIRTDYIKETGRWDYTVLFGGLAVILLFLGFMLFYKPMMLEGVGIMDHFSLIFKHPFRTVGVVSGLIILLGFVPIAGILYVNLAVYSTVGKKLEGITQAEASKDLKDKMFFFMLYLGLLVSATVIGTGLQQEMILQEITNGAVLFPDKMVHAYGFVFTFILFVLFVPSYTYLLQESDKIAQPDPASVPKKQKIWEIDEKTISKVKVALMVALPTIGSIVQQFFSIKK